MPKKIKFIEKAPVVNKNSIILSTHLHKLYKIFLSLKSIYRFKSAKNLPVYLGDIYQIIEDSTLETVNRRIFEELFFIFSNEMEFEKVQVKGAEQIKIKLKYTGEKNYYINILNNDKIKRYMATFGAIEIKRRDFFTKKIMEEVKSVETVKNGFEVITYKTPNSTKKENIERRKKELLNRLEMRKKKIKQKFISEISENTLKSKIRYLFKVENKKTLRLDYVQKKISVGDNLIRREEIEEIFQIRNLFGTFYVLNKLSKK